MEKIANVRLEHEDIIIIPAKTDLVHISGEVLMPQSVVFNSQASLEDYIAWAGGYSERADAGRVAVVHANGLLTFVDDDDSSRLEKQLKSGDQILVLPKVDSKNHAGS